MAIGIDPTVDYAFKRVFGNPAYPDVTIHFLNAVLGGSPRIASVTIENPNLDKDAVEDKLSVLDIAATDDHGRKINIEMQVRIHHSLPERLAYYAARQFTQQLAEGQTYGELRPSICICVLDDVMFPGVADLHLDFRFRNAAGMVLTDHRQIHTLELPKYPRPGDNEVIGSPLEMWLYFLKYAAASTPAELAKRLAESEFRRATGVLEMIARTPAEKAVYESRMKALRDAASKLWDSREEGRDEGREEGREEGRKEGELRGELRTIQRFIGEHVSTDDELSGLSLDQLQRLVEEARARFDDRQ